MPLIKHQIQPPNRNLDPSTPSPNALLVQDGYLDSSMAFHRRPGTKQLVNFSDKDSSLAGIGGNGHFWWQSRGIDIVVFGGRVFKITYSDGTWQELTGAVLRNDLIVTFAECFDTVSLESFLFMANGNRVVYTDGNTLNYLTGANIPTKVTHVISIDTYLICNDEDLPTTFHVSDVGSPFVFSQNYQYRSNEEILSIQNYQSKVMLIGGSGLEFWEDTGGASPFDRVGGISGIYGTVNPYCIGQLGADLIFLTNTRDIVAMNGLVPTPISQAYSLEIQKLGVIANAEADFVSSIGGREYFLISFPDSGRTIVFNVESKSFSEWGSVDNITNEYSIFYAHNYVYSNDWGYHMFLDRNNPIVYISSPDYYTDNGKTIKAQLILGWNDFGTGAKKRSRRLLINVKRGSATLVDTQNLITQQSVTITNTPDFTQTYNISTVNFPVTMLIAHYYGVLNCSISTNHVRFTGNSTDVSGIVHDAIDFKQVIPLFGQTTVAISINNLSTSTVWAWGGGLDAFKLEIDDIACVPTHSGDAVGDDYAIMRSGVMVFTLPDYTIQRGYISKYKFVVAAGTDIDFAVTFMDIPQNIISNKSPKLYLSWRDDGEQSWDNQLELDLGELGNTNTPIDVRGIGGIFNQRQYRFVFGDNSDLVINSIEEDVELLG